MFSKSRREMRGWVLLIFLLVGALFLLYKINASDYALNAFYNCRTEVNSAHDDTRSGAFIAARLESSEAIWKTSIEKRHEAMAQIELTELSEKGNIILWDFVYATFDCPFSVERIGRVGDGGKWVCGFEKIITDQTRKQQSSSLALSKRETEKRSCIIYSFGVAGETSFEREILSRTKDGDEQNKDKLPCLVRMYDPTVSPTPTSQLGKLLKEFPRASFDRLGIGKADSNQYRTLGSLMRANGDEFIDILKMDVEGSEYKAFEQIIHEFGENNLPFGQLQLEIHLTSLGPKRGQNIVDGFIEWFESLEAAGLRAFHREANYLPSLRNHDCFIKYFEYSFLNVKNDKNVVLHA